MKTIVLHTKLKLLTLLSAIRAWAAGPYCTGFLTHANGVHIIAAKRDVGVGRQLAFKGRYDPLHLKQYLELITAESRVLIVGTHVGSILLPIAKVAREVVGIEANPDSFRLLRMNIAINDLTNVTALNLAAFDGPAMLDFVASTANSGGAKVMPKHKNFEFFYDKPQIIKVRGAALDDELAGDFDFVLMDIEGAEYRAMAGMQRILSAAKHFICELVPNHMEHVDGCTVDDFMARIPSNFSRFSLTTNPQHVVDRSGLSAMYKAVEGEHHFGGSDLLCSVT